MAKKIEPGKVRVLERTILSQGKPVQGQNIQGPGDILFVQKLKRTDGKEILLQQTISVPRELFEKQETARLELRFKEKIPRLHPGNSFLVPFEVTFGTLPSQGKFRVMFSFQGKETWGNFQELPLALSYEKIEFTFVAPRVESSNCYLGLQVLDANGTMKGAAISNRFTISSVADIYLLSPLNRDLLVGYSVPIAWRLAGVNESYSDEMLLSFSVNGPEGQYTPFERRQQNGITGATAWNVPPYPDGTLLFLKLAVPQKALEKVFGPYTIKSRMEEEENRSLEKLREELDFLLPLLTSLPSFKERMPLPQFLLLLERFDAENFSKYIVAANRLREVREDLERAQKYFSKDSYAAFLRAFQKIEDARMALPDHKDPKYLKAAMRWYTMGFYRSLSLIDPKYRVPSVKDLTDEVHTNDIIYITSIFNRSKEIDEALGKTSLEKTWRYLSLLESGSISLFKGLQEMILPLSTLRKEYDTKKKT